MKTNPADKIEQWELERLTPYARNSRTHSDAQVAQLAASVREWGWTTPVLVSPDGGIIAGHGRVLAARQLGMAKVPVVVAEGWSEAKRRAYVIADNKLTENAGWDTELLALELGELGELGFDLDLTGFGGDEIAALTPGGTEGLTDPDEVPEPPATPVTKPGDLWLLGDHRVLCGDSTKAEDVERLMNGTKAQMIHADPPYGMGKEKDGVQNDNLYADKLDAFQMAWWRAFRPHAEDNASAYIWGNAEGLWRLWFVGGLSASERMTMRNEIVWDKGGGGFGVGTESQRCYFPEERCLFFMLGEQGFNNNADNYWDGWEPIRSYLDGERKRSGLTTDQCNKICGKQNMTQSAFTKGGFRLISKEDYEKLRDACNGDAFKREHDDLKQEHDELKQDFYATRAYFNNTHDNMTDVWEFSRVTGEERHGHATPKPVEMMARAIKSSTQDGGLLVEPFLGSGSTLIAAEQLGRKCYGMEISPAYVDVIVKRWQEFSGKKATREADGVAFDEAS